MMDLHWLEQSEDDLPAGIDWLSPGEELRLASLRFAKRRADWLLGRWTAKRAVAECLGNAHPLREIEIRAAPSGAPEVFCANRPAGFAISLSHRGGAACCAVMHGEASLGCDLELIETRSAAFAADYFTEEEQGWIARVSADRHQLVTLIWSAKESVLKALGVGLRQDTRAVTVKEPVSSSAAWRPLLARHGDIDFRGWWRTDGILVRTVVALPPLPPPVPPRPGLCH